jgi:cell division protein FtsZ
MGLDIKAPENVILKPVITVFGVGGAGGNAVNNMIKANLRGANFVVANTDAQALKHSESPNKIQLGAQSTKGLGAGANPEVGKEAAIESQNEIRSYLEGSNMLFITAGMGGGTGTGASPEIAKIAKELNILTVGVVTKPFLFEGARRMKLADAGLAELHKYVDTLIVIPNQNLFRIANENTTFQQAFEMADEVLHAGVRGVTDLITSPGLVNLDFADIETVMGEKGKAMMGTGEASGEDRAIKAAEAAIANPLLDQSSMHGACGVLINITGGKDMTLYEVDSAANRIREEVGDSDANIIFGSTFNPDLEGVIRISVVATGIEQKDMNFSRVQEKIIGSSINESRNDDVTSENYVIEDIPPSYDEYQEQNSQNKNDIEKELQERIEELTRDTDWNKFESIISQEVESRIKQKPTKSLLKRMWQSLKSGDSKHDVEHQSEKERSFSSSVSKLDIKDVPSFMKKDR